MIHALNTKRVKKSNCLSYWWVARTFLSYYYYLGVYLCAYVCTAERKGIAFALKWFERGEVVNFSDLAT
jgi:hypothetical protein